MVGEIFKKGRSTYGARRIQKKLIQKKVTISRRKVSKLMKESNLEVKTKRKFKATTDSSHNQPIAPNLLDRKFDAVEPNRYWVGDITYVPTEEGWLYLAAVIDLYSRKVIGWSIRVYARKTLLTTPATGFTDEKFYNRTQTSLQIMY